MVLRSKLHKNFRNIDCNAKIKFRAFSVGGGRVISVVAMLFVCLKSGYSWAQAARSLWLPACSLNGHFLEVASLTSFSQLGRLHSYSWVRATDYGQYGLRVHSNDCWSPAITTNAW